MAFWWQKVSRRNIPTYFCTCTVSKTNYEDIELLVIYPFNIQKERLDCFFKDAHVPLSSRFSYDRFTAKTSCLWKWGCTWATKRFHLSVFVSWQETGNSILLNCLPFINEQSFRTFYIVGNQGCTKWITRHIYDSRTIWTWPLLFKSLNFAAFVLTSNIIIIHLMGFERIKVRSTRLALCRPWSLA